MNGRMFFSRLRSVTTLFDSPVYACKLLERILKLVLKLAVFYEQKLQEKLKRQRTEKILDYNCFKTKGATDFFFFFHKRAFC